RGLARGDLRDEDDREIETLARVHGEEAHGVVLVREGRRLDLACRAVHALLEALEEATYARLAIGHGDQLPHVRDALLAARKEDERLLEAERAHGLAKDAARPEPIEVAPERVDRGADAKGRLLVLGAHERAAWSGVPGRAHRQEAAARCG